MGFQASLADSSLFIMRYKKIIFYLLVYVDDIILTRNNPQFINSLIYQLSKTFELKDLGSLHYFLGLQITRTSKGLFLSQTKYDHDLLLRHNMHTSKPARSPCAPNPKLVLTEGFVLSNPHEYKIMDGSLHYLTFTRLDLSFSVHQVCQFMATPTDTHLIATKRILRYLNGTLHFGIFLQTGPFSFSA